MDWVNAWRELLEQGLEETHTICTGCESIVPLQDTRHNYCWDCAPARVAGSHPIFSQRKSS